ncbi:MAG: EndoU domain-containing protein [Hydrogenophaga sp.]|nr:EndoU domain-containing protein [Hydrogenophaga sp.]MDO9437887.1 EndoU domain-containing protein [Hydrogenophaga sp.]
MRIAAAEYIRAIDPSLNLRTLQERDETLLLAQNSMGGVAVSDVVGGYAATVREGVEALISGAKTAAQASMGDPQAQAALSEGAGQLWSTVKDPEQWPYLLGAMTPAQREELAVAYERGDIQTVGRLMGAQVANLPSGAGMGSIRRVVGLPTPNGNSPIDIAHTIGGDYNVRTGRVTGGHTLLNGDVRVTQVVSPPDANGVYEAFVEIQAPDGSWQTKTVGSTGAPQRNTMFPSNWNASKIQAEIDSAWVAPDRTTVGTKWSGTSKSGVRIEGYTTPRATAFPVR